MRSRLDLGGLRIDVVRKDIRHLHLTVCPPHGAVRIAAPSWVTLESIRLFAINKLGWVRTQQAKLRAQPREYIERESHYLWGRRYLLHVVECDAPPSIVIRHRRLEIRVRPGTTADRRAELLAAWYRGRVHAALPALATKWEPQIGSKPHRIFVQRMKTKWGSCNASSQNIRLNTDLAKKPPECLEYVLVHEMVHLDEPTHGPRFIALMDRLLPHWRGIRARLNRLPV